MRRSKLKFDANRRTIKLDQMLEKRKAVLDRLEVAETRFIRSFKANLPRPTTPVDGMQGEKEGGMIASAIATGNLSRNLSVVSNTTDHPFEITY